MIQTSDLSISPGEDAATVTDQTTSLVDDGKWHLCNAGKGVERTFKFKTFKTTWVLPCISSHPILPLQSYRLQRITPTTVTSAILTASQDFMNDVAAECKRAKHHPEWTNVYNRVHVRWTTHSPEGLSTKDTGMARFCDEAAGKFGELAVEEGEAGMGTGREGGDWRAQVKDCCGPKA